MLASERNAREKDRPSLERALPARDAAALGGERIEPVEYRQTEHYALSRDFLNDPERYLKRLLVESPPEPNA